MWIFAIAAAAAAPARADHHAVGTGSFDVSLEVDRARFMVSEPVYATVVYRGSGTEIEMSWMGENALGRPDNYKLTFVQHDGTALPVPSAGPQFGGHSWGAKLAPDHPAHQRLLLPLWVSALVPGHYTVHLETTIRARRAGSTSDADWVQTPVAADVAVDVVADDAAALAKVFTALGDRAVGSNHDDAGEAMRAMQTVGDPRIAPQWARVAAVAEYEHKLDAVWGCEKLTGDAALDVIASVGKTQAADLARAAYTTDDLRVASATMLRVAAAQALAEFASPKAWPPLLAMRGDTSPDVRLEVAVRAARLPHDEARKYLTALAGDPDKRVATEVKRMLDELK
jgi:hypothetical protein